MSERGSSAGIRRALPALVVFTIGASAPDPGRAGGAGGAEILALQCEVRGLEPEAGFHERALGFVVATRDHLPAAPSGGEFLVRGPSWIRFLATGPASPEVGRELAARAFERLRGLAGRWRASSTRGWDEIVAFEVAARGSVVVATTRFEDAPDRTMMTMYHMDGDRLVLTHYCEAMNQPRLAATEIGAGGRRVVFTFLDGANIATRSVGHMDKAVYEFIDRDRFSSQWTWYEDGKESWMEEIVYERVR